MLNWLDATSDRRTRSQRTALWALLIATLLLTLSFGVPAAAHASSTDDAVANQLDANHDGYQTAPITAPLTQLWSDPLPAATYSGNVTSAPLLVNGVVYITYNGTLYAIQQATGDALWSKSIAGPYDVLMIGYDAGDIFAVNDPGSLTAINATTGVTVWSTQMPGQSEFESAPVAAGNVVYVTGSGDAGTLYAVSESTGSVLWVRGLENGEGSVAIDGGNVFTTEACDYFDSFNASTGMPTWSDAGNCDGGGAATPVAADGDVFAPSTEGTTSAILSEATGSQLGPLGTSLDPAVANDVVYAVSGDDLTATNDSGLGTTVWSFTNAAGFTDSPLVVGGLVIAVSADGTVYALDAGTGTVDWSDATGEAVTGAGEYENGGIASGENTLLVPTSTALIAYAGANAGSGIPTNSIPATIVGTPIENEAIGADVGVWTGLPTSYRYQWLDCSESSCNNITGATGEAYSPTSAEVGTTLEASIVATNAAGSSTAYVSSPSDPVEVGPPANTSLPSITGQPVVGDTLTASPGAWSPAASSYTYQWLECYSSTDCQALGTPTSSNQYVLGASTEGATIAVDVTASDSSGEGGATSLPTSAVTQVFAPTTMTISSSQNPAPAGATVVFTATLSSPVDGGTLTFSQNGTPVSGCSDLSMDLNVAYVTCTAEALDAGTIVIAASYSGDTNYGPSSASVSEAITQSNTGTGTGTSTSSASSAPTITITHAPSATTANTSVGYTTTGAVTQVDCTLDGTSTICSETTAGLTDLQPGSHTFTAVATGPYGKATTTVTWTTVLPLDAPQNFRAHKASGGYTVTWKRLPGATAYRLAVTISGHTTVRTLRSGVLKSYIAVRSHRKAEFSLYAIGKNGVPGKTTRLHV